MSEYLEGITIEELSVKWHPWDLNRIWDSRGNGVGKTFELLPELKDDSEDNDEF